jgi:hypothetical protein
MSNQQEAAADEKPPAADEKPLPVKELPGGPWYRTLDEAIHAWAADEGHHNVAVDVPRIRVYVRSHVGGWNVS